MQYFILAEDSKLIFSHLRQNFLKCLSDLKAQIPSGAQTPLRVGELTFLTHLRQFGNCLADV